MIVAPQTSRPSLTLLGCALFALVTGLSLTREVQAQPQPAVRTLAATTPPRTVAAPAGTTEVVSDTLDQLFPTGTVATIGDRAITVEDVRREMGPLMYHLRRDARSPEELKQKVLQLQNSVISDLLRRILLIKEFPTHGPDGPRHIAAEQIDNRITEILETQYGGDRAKLLADLKARNLTLSDYRKSIEEEIIYRYMMKQEAQFRRPTQPAIQEPKTHLRLIQFSRAEGETDDALRLRANAALTRFKNGEKFADLAKELSNDTCAARGGDWGWLGLSDLRADYHEPFKALKTGEISAPIIAKEGAFLLYAEDRK